jgi:mRNA interferase RelE/StbE
MSKTLVFSTSAARTFLKLPGPVQERLTTALYKYGREGSGDVKRMVGTPTVRLRDGDYRVIFDEEETRLVILAVGHWREIYR